MRLIFVYNAKAGFLNGMMDSLHKTVSPDTYDCGLCAITHGFFKMDKDWRAYLKSIPYEADFYHRPDFCEKFPGHKGEKLPLIGLDDKGALSVLLGPEAIKACPDVNALAAAINSALPVAA